VHFSVEDVAAWNGAPAGRRRFLDVALCQLEPAYVGHLRDYTGALRQRNRLLVERGPEDPDQLGAWEEILARSGAELDRRRGAVVTELDGMLRELAGQVDPELDRGVAFTLGQYAQKVPADVPELYDLLADPSPHVRGVVCDFMPHHAGSRVGTWSRGRRVA
jgi:recombinational DNA repair ATPase RecF